MMSALQYILFKNTLFRNAVISYVQLTAHSAVHIQICKSKSSFFVQMYRVDPYRKCAMTTRVSHRVVLKHESHKHHSLISTPVATDSIIRVNGAHLGNTSQIIRTIIIALALRTRAMSGPRTAGRRRRRRRCRPTAAAATLAAVARQIIATIVVAVARGPCAMALPRAGRLRCGRLGRRGGRRRAARAADAGHKLVAQGAQRRLKGRE